MNNSEDLLKEKNSIKNTEKDTTRRVDERSEEVCI
jgi:hypothetical protein